MIQNFAYRDQPFQAYLAVPPSKTGIGILLCHAWWGLTDVFVDICDRLAVEGCVVLAPDLFHGETARTINSARKLRSQVNRSHAKKEVRACVDYLGNHDAVIGSALGTIGFSYGCSFAVEAARLRPQMVKAVTLFYGTAGGKLDKTEAAYQGHFAEQDEWGANPGKAEKLEGRIRQAGREAEFYYYPHTTHWFFEQNNQAYNPEAAQLAWQRTITFMRERLQD